MALYSIIIKCGSALHDIKIDDIQLRVRTPTIYVEISEKRLRIGRVHNGTYFAPFIYNLANPKYRVSTEDHTMITTVLNILVTIYQYTICCLRL